jgi:hypothetical protein
VMERATAGSSLRAFAACAYCLPSDCFGRCHFVTTGIPVDTTVVARGAYDGKTWQRGEDIIIIMGEEGEAGYRDVMRETLRASCESGWNGVVNVSDTRTCTTRVNACQIVRSV